MADTKLKASCYYPLVVRALRPGVGGENFTIHTETGKINCKVAGSQAHAARIEATALLDLAAISENAGRVGAAYWSRKWRSKWWAPFGLGNRSNALVPGRDFAHGGASGAAWPHGTRIEFRGDIPEKLEGLIRPVMYRGDVFGDSKAAGNPRRCDLYTTEPCARFGPISVRVTKPWRGNRNHKISAETVRGFQQCARLLGLKGKNGKLLSPDNDWGEQTEYAIKLFLAEFDGLFHWAVPDYIKDRPRPWDSEIYFLVRQAAKEKVG